MTYINKIGANEFELSPTPSGWSDGSNNYKINTLQSKNIIVITDKEGKEHKAVIQDIDTKKKKVKVLLNQKELVIEILEPIDQKMLSLGIDTKRLQKTQNIKAPMPGLILKTLVKEGQNVKVGDALFILEAMKMENIFKAPDDVEIKNILIKEGDTVDKNQKLIVFA